MTTTKQLTEKRNTLAAARATKRVLEDKQEEIQEELHALPVWIKYCAIRKAVEMSKSGIKDVEQELRETAVGLYDETRAASPIDGVSVYQSADIEITDESALYTWLAEKARYILKVDRRKLVKLAHNSEEIDGVEAVKVPKARIAKDLTAYEPNSAERSLHDEPNSV